MAGDFNVDLNRFDGSEDTYTIMLDTLNALEPTYKSFLNDWEYKGTTSGLNHFYCCNPDGKQHLDYILVSAKHKIPYMLSNRSQQARLNEPDESFGIFDMGDHEPVYARIEFPVLSSTTDALVSCLGNTVQLDAGPAKPAPGGSFQWYRNEELLPGENNTTLNISLNNAEDFATYTCRHTYEYIPDTSINNFFDYTYMDYRWIFRGVTTGEISTVFNVVPTDSSETCYGVPTLVPVLQGKTPFKIFPNPAHDYIDISGDEMSGYTFEIVDMLGQKMQPSPVTLSGQMARIEIKNFARGTYFVRGSKNNGRYIAPFIKVQ